MNNDTFRKLLKDIKVEMDDEFDLNFKRKAFFDRSWKPAKVNTIGSLMMRTGALRKSLRSIIETNGVRWTSSLPYSNIHNSGGDIIVTVKMKKYAWYRVRMLTGNNPKMDNPEIAFWRAMALKPVGSVIHIPQRQFVGDHQQVHKAVRKAAEQWFEKEMIPEFKMILKPS